MSDPSEAAPVVITPEAARLAAQAAHNSRLFALWGALVLLALAAMLAFG